MKDWIYDKLPELIKPGYTIFDVGAHRGDYTDRFRELTGSDGRVIAFELDPNNYKKLTERFVSNDNVVLHHFAVSDTDEEIDYYKGKDTFTGNILGHDTSYNPNSVAGKIEATRLDTCYPGRPIDFLKIDVEGAEIKVLHGCEGIIDNIKNMLVECHLEKEWPELRALILGYGFTCKNLLDGTPVTESSDRPYQCLCWK